MKAEEDAAEQQVEPLPVLTFTTSYPVMHKAWVFFDAQCLITMPWQLMCSQFLVSRVYLHTFVLFVSALLPRVGLRLVFLETSHQSHVTFGFFHHHQPCCHGDYTRYHGRSSGCHGKDAVAM